MTGADSRAVSPDVPLVDRHVAPPDRPLALGGNRLLDHLFDQQPALGVGRQVAHAHAVAAGRRELDARRGAAQEGVGDLQQDPGAVTGVGIGALGAAMLEVLQRVERLLDHGMTRLSPQLRHEGDAARVVLVGGIVEAHGLWGDEAILHIRIPGSGGLRGGPSYRGCPVKATSGC